MTQDCLFNMKILPPKLSVIDVGVAGDLGRELGVLRHHSTLTPREEYSILGISSKMSTKVIVNE